MAETKMNVKLLAHTQLSDKFYRSHSRVDFSDDHEADYEATHGQAVALSAIRTCYSANKPSEIASKEGAKYFENNASDGGGGGDGRRPNIPGDRGIEVSGET